MNKEDATHLGWEDICQKRCHDYKLHSHQFTIGRHIKKICANCAGEMIPEAQIYENELGKNRAVLYNAYTCKQGHSTDIHLLYDGLPRAYSEIYKMAFQNSQIL